MQKTCHEKRPEPDVGTGEDTCHLGLNTESSKGQKKADGDGLVEEGNHCRFAYQLASDGDFE